MDLHRFRPRLLDSLRGYDRQHLLKDLGAGITVEGENSANNTNVRHTVCIPPR